MRRIMIGDKVHDIDISDGKGARAFGMNGGGGMSVWLDGVLVGTNCYFDSRYGLDGTVRYRREGDVVQGDMRYLFMVDDPIYDRLKMLSDISFGPALIDSLSKEQRIETILLGLRLQPVMGICHGYQFGKELTMESFCVTFDSQMLVAYSSRHNGYLARDILSLMKTRDWEFRPVYRAVRRALWRYFS